MAHGRISATISNNAALRDSSSTLLALARFIELDKSRRPSWRTTGRQALGIRGVQEDHGP
jgi:hypothetical protein